MAHRRGSNGGDGAGSNDNGNDNDNNRGTNDDDDDGDDGGGRSGAGSMSDGRGRSDDAAPAAEREHIVRAIDELYWRSTTGTLRRSLCWSPYSPGAAMMAAAVVATLLRRDERQRRRPSPSDREAPCGDHDARLPSRRPLCARSVRQ